jgi:Na+/H+-dicarboxylate symporter
MNLGNIGLAEFVAAMFMACALFVIPVLIVVWLLVTVHRIRRRLDAISARLDALAPPSINP